MLSVYVVKPNPAMEVQNRQGIGNSSTTIVFNSRFDIFITIQIINKFCLPA